MALFQQTVKRYMGAGIVGEIAFYGPHRVEPGVIAAAKAENAYIGRFYTKDAATGEFSPGGTIDNVGTLFGGIAISPKELAAFGTQAGGPLAASLFIGNQIGASFMSMGFVWLRNADGLTTQQGMRLVYVIETGVISLAPGDTGEEGGTPVPAGAALVPNAVVYREPGATQTGGMYVAQLTN